MILVVKLILEMLSKIVIHFFTYYVELKYFCLFKTENGFTMLTFFPILIVVVLFGVIVLQSWKTNLYNFKRELQEQY